MKEVLLLTGDDLPRKCREAIEKIIEVCLMDPDLGIPNRLYWEVLGRRELEIAKRLGSPLSLLFVDVDGLKKINDTYGHLAGDLYLKRIVKILKSFVRASDLVIRWGGDEFLILLHTDEKGARIVKERIYSAMEKVKVEIGAKVFKPSVSIGEAQINGNFQNALVLADNRMYEEKKLRKFNSQL